MACDITYSRSGIVPLAYFRMIREEQRCRQTAHLNGEQCAEGAPQSALTKQCTCDCTAEDAMIVESNIVASRHVQGR